MGLKRIGEALPSTGAVGAEAKSEAAGTLRDGTPVTAITLSNRHGIGARILTYGATLQSLIAPDRNGHPADVVLGYDDLASYVDRPNFFGVTVGRYANRIAGGRFSLDGKTYQLPLNDKSNSLHGGGPDGDSGYPGNLDVTSPIRSTNRATLASRSTRIPTGRRWST